MIIGERCGEGSHIVTSLDPQFISYEQAAAAFTQPLDWSQLIGSLSPTQLPPQTGTWSPAEKYDLTVGDESFSLTNEQKGEGRKFMDEAKKTLVPAGWESATAGLLPPSWRRALIER